jgi:hypothetical protein
LLSKTSTDIAPSLITFYFSDGGIRFLHLQDTWN